VAELVGDLPPADLRSAFHNAPMGVALVAPDGTLADVNPALCVLVGRSATELRGSSVFALVHPDDAPAAAEARAELEVRPDRPMRVEVRLVRADGTPVQVQVTASWVDEGDAGHAHMVVFLEDITERKTLEAQLLHRSLHDPLTGLPNRLLFRDRLLHALERGARERTPTCVLVVDLDGFKAVNDEHGHAIGDQVLVAVAERLISGMRASDTAARLGGDEFAVVCENTDRPDAEVLAGRLRAAIREPFVLGTTTVRLGTSIGIGHVAGGAEPEQVVERVVREADDAMYAEKSARR
jgi:diguanylate cyclase (GGDEF)-like protein/PAS domain S-box-containing protein